MLKEKVTGMATGYPFIRPSPGMKGINAITRHV